MEDNMKGTSMPRWLKIGILVFAIVVILPLAAFLYGLMVGPYSGQVIDGQTGKPLAGASVLIAWEARIRPLHEPVGVAGADLLTTDEQGRYHQSRTMINPFPIIHGWMEEIGKQVPESYALLAKTIALVAMAGMRFEPKVLIYQFGYQCHPSN
jgi:hypothetical protein